MNQSNPSPAEGIIIFIHAQAVKQEDGTFEPSISAIKQEGRRFTQLELDQEVRLEATTAEEAILLGRKAAYNALREKFSNAELKIKGP